MALAPEFLAILRCPESKEPLLYFPDGASDGGEPFLFCPASRLRYRIGDHDLPIMLIDEAVRVDEEESERLQRMAAERDPAG